MVAPSGLGFGVAAALAWGVLLFVRKRLFPTLPATVFMAGGFYAGALWYLPLVVAFDRPNLSPPSLTSTQALVVAGTLVGLAGGLLFVFAALNRGDVSYVAPISKVTPAFVLPLEVLLFSERLGALAIAGILLATAAVYLANFDGRDVVEPFRRVLDYRPAQLALGSALVIAFVNLGQRVVLQDVALEPTFWVALKLLVVPAVLTPFALRRASGLSRAVAVRLLAVGGVVALAEYLVSLTFAAIPASVATPLVGLQAVVAVLLGGFLLDEERLALRLTAALVAVAGIGLIAAA